MKRSLFTVLLDQFSKYSESLTTLDLENYLRDFPHTEVKTELQQVTLFFQRAWIQTCLNGHLDGVKKIQRLIQENQSQEKIHQTYTTTWLWLAHAKQLFATFRMLHAHLTEHSLSPHIITAQHLRFGDVILSYKTRLYMQHSPLSRMIQFMTHSAITHAMIACHEIFESPTLLMSDDTTQGLGTIAPITEPGEIYLVFEPRAHPALPNMHRAVRNYYQLALEKSSDYSLQHILGFPRLKCEMACLIGLFYILSGFFRRKPLMLRNPLEHVKGMFCSEFIDSLFRDAGIQLTPRSEHRAIVGPVEFLYSPHLRFKGILGDPHTIEHASEEITQQFGSLMNPTPNNV